MADCEYWKGIVADLRTKPNWAAHVLATDDENLEYARECVADEVIINNVLLAYNDEDWLTRSDCDHILSQFEKESVERVYNVLTELSENARQSMEGLLSL
jgi:hypothetical protein